MVHRWVTGGWSVVFGATLLGSGCESSKPSAQPAPNAVATEQASPDVVPVDRAEGEAFSLSWQASGPVALGQFGSGQLVLEPKPPFKCNQEYPYKLKLVGTDLAPSKAEVSGSDIQLAKERVVVPVSFKANKVGPMTLDGTFAFSVCTSDKCLIEHQAIKMTAQVTTAVLTPSVEAATTGAGSAHPAQAQTLPPPAKSSK